MISYNDDISKLIRKRNNFLCFSSRTMEATGTRKRWFNTYWLGGGIAEEQYTYIIYCNWSLRPD